MSEYLAITIGPISKMMALTSTPAGLWGMSYLFSYIAKSLCQKLIDCGVDESQFLTPVLEFDGDGKIVNPKPGVGLFHDHIIIKQEAGHPINIEELDNRVTHPVEEEIGENLAKVLSPNLGDDVKTYVKNILQIHGVAYSCDSSKNPLLVGGDLLDAMELQTQYVTSETINYILQLMENTERDENNEGRNELIKESFLVEDFAGVGAEKNYDVWPLTQGNRRKLRTLEEIALGRNPEVTMKKHQYYAVIQADGDNMGTILKSFKATETQSIDEQIRTFSGHCFNYCKAAVEIASNYGAVTIYAGGDDFLALAPLENIVVTEEQATGRKVAATQSIFDLVHKLSSVFSEEFKEYSHYGPSLSFGVSLQYYKYPLYEAFDKAVELLFDYSKKTIEGDSTKNALSLNLQKHAGQSMGLKIKKIDDDRGIYSLVCSFLKKRWEDPKDQSNFLKSVGYTIYNYRTLFKEAITSYIEKNKKEPLKNLFDNLFDADAHQKNDELIGYIAEIRTLLFTICNHSGKIMTLETKKDEEQVIGILDILDFVLRLMKFYTEEGTEE